MNHLDPASTSADKALHEKNRNLHLFDHYLLATPLARSFLFIFQV